MKRLLTGAVAAALLGVTPVAISTAPAAAAAATTVTIERAWPSGNPVEFNDEVKFVSSVTSGGSSVYDGTVHLQRRKADGSWATVQTQGASGYVSWNEFRAKSKGTYRAVYTGYGSTYAGDVSSARGLPVARKLTIKSKSARKGVKFIGKVKPTYKRKKVVIHKKVKGKWRKYRTVRTNKRSKFTTKLPAKGKRTYWRFTVKGSKQFVPTKQVWYTIRYREQARTMARTGG